jgi:6,7-dimethyl-8-ribityllumazine synthase
MAKRIEGKLIVSKQRFGLVVSRFNEFIGSRLVSGAIDALVRHGCQPENITEVWVPGAWELPLAVKTLARSDKVDAVVALGCVIRGNTPHFDYIANEVTKGLAQVALDSGVPVSLGVVTADTLEQAIERAGTKMGNKGADAALAAVEMLNLVAQLSASKKR